MADDCLQRLSRHSSRFGQVRTRSWVVNALFRTSRKLQRYMYSPSPIPNPTSHAEACVEMLLRCLTAFPTQDVLILEGARLKQRVCL